MNSHTLYVFLFIIAIASYLQALTGFALGVFALGGVIALNVASIDTASTVINVLMVVNVAIALINRGSSIEWRLYVLSLIGMIPGGYIGVYLLREFSLEHAAALKFFLGALIVYSALTMVLKARKRDDLSPPWQFVLYGFVGGVCGGTYSIPGPPVVLLFYRQPMAIDRVRCTLLAIFGTLSVFRLGVLGAQGFFSTEIMKLSIITVPVVVVASVLFAMFPPQLPEKFVRKSASIILLVLGGAVMAIGV